MGLPRQVTVRPEAVFVYLTSYTDHIAISNRHLIGFDAAGVSFRVGVHRRDGAERLGTAFLCDTLVVHV